jgi:serine kinase of HPr protein (carbohydrate metabolism regulator)
MKVTTEINPIEELAKFIHKEYERIAKEKKWKTQKRTKVKFENLPIENKETMLEISKRIFKWFEDKGVNGYDDFYNYICINKEWFEI